MKHPIWQGEITDKDWEQLTEQDLDQICDDLEIYFEQLVKEHLKQRGIK